MMLRGVRFWLMICACVLMAASYAEADPSLSDSVVKVFVTSNEVDFLKPWQSAGIRSSTGSGCIISGNRILTNAHVVENSTFIQVRKESSPKKYTARVMAIANDCDLAILSVNDTSFFDQTRPLTVGELPSLRDQVIVVGFPMGGDKISITEGVVSRIEVIPYAQSSKRLLGVQIDAAINPGNSGGPVFQDGKVVGIAMQLQTNSQNIGYMIPPPVIEHFLTDLEDGQYDGFPILGIEYHSTENSAQKEVYHIPDKEDGVVIVNTQPFAPAEDVLKKGDVILAVDGVSVAEDGSFSHPKAGFLSFSYLISQKQIGDKMNLKVLRNGVVSDMGLVLDSISYLVAPPKSVDKPSYYIYGGLVFSVLSVDLLHSWGDQWWHKAPFDFLYYLIGKGRLNLERRKEVVVLLDILPDDKNIGYLNFQNQVITQVNDQDFVSFKEFVQLVEQAAGDYISFTTLDGAQIIISRKDIDAVTDKILERNGILRRFSRDVEGWI